MTKYSLAYNGKKLRNTPGKYAYKFVPMPSASEYSYYETLYAGTTICSGTFDEASFGPMNIGFTFRFFDVSYNQFHLNTNGMVSFVPDNIEADNVAIPNVAIPNNFIAHMWDDMIMASSGRISYATIGTTPNRKLVIQYHHSGFYPSPVFGPDVQIILHETTNEIKIQYRTITDKSSFRSYGGSATIGIENSTGTAGVQYSYNTLSVSDKTVLLFIPNASTYTLDSSNAQYDFLYLPANIAVSEGGFCNTISPNQDMWISMPYTFSWNAAQNASAYNLLISTFSDLGSATTYYVGNSTSKLITNLSTNTMYYWGALPTNAAWCEINRFYVVADPTLNSIPQTYWVKKTYKKTITLGNNTSTPKTAIVTSLPYGGHLYQTSGDLIMRANTIVTDASRRVIYIADGSYGNRAGNFTYKVRQESTYSPESLITINVMP